MKDRFERIFSYFDINDKDLILCGIITLLYLFMLFNPFR